MVGGCTMSVSRGALETCAEANAVKPCVLSSQMNAVNVVLPDNDPSFILMSFMQSV